MLRKRFLSYAVILFLTSSLFAQDKLENIYMIEIARLQETWNVLDQFAEKVWPGWNGYLDYPFMFEYPNMVKLLIGHPDPPAEFEEVKGLTIRGKKVYIDRSKEIPIKLEPPFLGGGGPMPFGKPGGKSVRTVFIWLAPAEDRGGFYENMEKDTSKYALASENQILINIHELFHCYQVEFLKKMHRDVEYVPDLNFSEYSEIEGKALENAYREMDYKKTVDYLKDFIVARETKRKNMPENEKKSESGTDFMEGTAVYSTFQTLLMMKNGYRPVLDQTVDPFFYGFENPDYYIDLEMKKLAACRKLSFDISGKCYQYGCFQALLLTRLYPGWIDDFMGNQRFLEEILKEKVPVDKNEKVEISNRLKNRYNYDEIKANHKKPIEARDKAIEIWENQKGKTYVVNFEPTGEFVDPITRGETYRVGAIVYLPEGIKEFKTYDISFKGEETPMQVRTHILKWIDTESVSNDKGYILTFDKKEGENIFTNAKIVTKGFTLNAPKIQVEEVENKVEINVLLKLRADN